MSKRRPFGNIKMRGKRVVENPCPCCDPIENKKDDLVEEIQRTELEQWVHDNVRYVHRAYYIHPMFEDKEYQVGTLEDQEKFEKSRGGLLGKISVPKKSDPEKISRKRSY